IVVQPTIDRPQSWHGRSNASMPRLLAAAPMPHPNASSQPRMPQLRTGNSPLAEPSTPPPAGWDRAKATLSYELKLAGYGLAAVSRVSRVSANAWCVASRGPWLADKRAFGWLGAACPVGQRIRAKLFGRTPDQRDRSI